MNHVRKEDTITLYISRLLFCILLFFITCTIVAQDKNFASYVNPFIGTGGHGHTYPGASVPFGMVQLSPDTRLSGWDGCSAYHYSDSVIYGFSHTHLSGTGCSDYGDILMMPVAGDPVFDKSEYSSGFDHDEEIAEVGYYSVKLNKYNILAELTASSRAGFHKYTYSGPGQAGLVVDLKHRDKVIDSYLEVLSNTEIRGMRRSQAWAKDQTIYFFARFSKPIKGWKFSGAGLDSVAGDNGKTTFLSGEDVVAWFGFDLEPGQVLTVKVGVSSVSTEGAAMNLDAELSEKDFEKVRLEAKQTWNEELGKIEIVSKDEEQIKVFYSALYHCMLSPNLFMDVDGQYRGTDLKVHQADKFDYYTVFSLWDTYRAEHPLLTIIDTKRTLDFIKTFLAQYQNGGLLPVWELSGNETFCMIGYHAVPVIVDAFEKGIDAFDTDLALKAMKASAEADRFGLNAYHKNGYIPIENESESVSRTLEYSYDDWCIAHFASVIGMEKDYENYIHRAQSYKNIFDPGSGFIRARANGGWYEPFDPAEVNFNYTEANSWQYSFYVPHDISGWAALMGGKDKLAIKLDELFNAEEKLSGREQADITGLIGQYAHGNEPSHHIAYLYNYVNQPWKTQAMISRLSREMYRNATDGLCGNEDCGQMSAWFVMSALGFYQVCPGKGDYAIGSPMFEKAIIYLENGRSFTINANKAGVSNPYIQSAILNGNVCDRSFLKHSEIMAGGEITFEMGSEPNKNWAADDDDAPSTAILDFPLVIVPLVSAKGKTFYEKMEVELKPLVAGQIVYYTMDGSEPDSSNILYTGPIELTASTSLKAKAYEKGKGSSSVVEANFFKIPKGRSIVLKTNFDPQYTAGGQEAVIDYIRGGNDFRTGGWQGYQETDFEAIVNLGEDKKISRIAVGFLQDIGSWIWMPREVEISVSSDGKHYKVLQTVSEIVPESDYTPVSKDVEYNKKTRGQYVRVKAKNYGPIPQWHLGAGGKSWIFIDEISIE